MHILYGFVRLCLSAIFSLMLHKNKLAFEINLGLLLGLFNSVEMWVLGANHIVCVDIHNQISQILITF